MILIEASRTGSSGGALILLKLLIEKLLEGEHQFFLIKDSRWVMDSDSRFDYEDGGGMILGRKRLVTKYINKLKPSVLLCFGSLPPSFKVPPNVKVYTYFHNPNLLDVFASKELYGFYKNLIWRFKKIYLKLFVKNTDYFIFQTNFIKRSFISQYSVDPKHCMLYPFFDEDRMDELNNEIDSVSEIYDFCYISLPYPHKGHINLVKALIELKEEFGETPSLVITCPEGFNLELDELIKGALMIGVNIVNVGLVNLTEAWRYQKSSKACIFPSSRETLGLGLVEACKMGKVILCSDIDVLKDVVVPSMTFDPNSTSDIASSMLQSLRGSLVKGDLKLRNRLNDFLEILRNPII